jgi:uncharacterized protein YndB with AHSA1/START domain
MADYSFLTEWRIQAPKQDVYDAILNTHEWPHWWVGVESVADVQASDADGVGSIKRYTWKSASPYRIRFDARTIRIVKGVEIVAVVEGDLAGGGRWTFSENGDVTVVRYLWQVQTERLWMNLLAPLARPLFRRNHHLLMEQGAQGLARRLSARLVGVTHADGDTMQGMVKLA